MLSQPACKYWLGKTAYPGNGLDTQVKGIQPRVKTDGRIQIFQAHMTSHWFEHCQYLKDKCIYFWLVCFSCQSMAMYGTLECELKRFLQAEFKFHLYLILLCLTTSTVDEALLKIPLFTIYWCLLFHFSWDICLCLNWWCKNITNVWTVIWHLEFWLLQVNWKYIRVSSKCNQLISSSPHHEFHRVRISTTNKSDTLSL